MKALADYVHSKGLKIGIYSSPGAEDLCQVSRAALGHEAQDAKTYADWGIDYLKYDLCSFRKNMEQEAPNDQRKATQMMNDAYEKMHQALLATAVPSSTASASTVGTRSGSGGRRSAATCGAPPETSIRHYDRMTLIGFAQAGLAKYAGPGHWNDPDMLEVGNGKLTLDENRTHMSLWAMLAAPLLAGNDLTQMTPEIAS